MALGRPVSVRCCTHLEWIIHWQCFLVTNQTFIAFLFFIPLGGCSRQYFQLVILSPQHLESWPLTCWTLAFCMYFQIWLCYSTVWHFQRSQPLLVHLVPSMSMFLCSAWVFPGQMSGVWVLVRTAEGADRHHQSILSGRSVIFSAVTASLISQA